MTKQLDQEVADAIDRERGSTADLSALKKPFALPKFGGSAQDLEAMREYLAPRSLVPDANTEADIAAGKPPSYHVIYQNPDGTTAAIAGPDGKALRFRFDPAPAQAELAAQAEKERATNADAQRAGSIPVYGGGL